MREVGSGIMDTVTDSRIQVRPARADDGPAVAALARQLAMSFPFSSAAFDQNFLLLLAAPDVCLLVATDGDDRAGYLLGFRHLTFFAGGPVGWVEEILVSQRYRETGTGRALMDAFERWAAGHGCPLVALATRRAAPFYQAIGYEESATYFRKMLTPGSD
jgi:GNAT superfamily N-acetyltransferase